MQPVEPSSFARVLLCTATEKEEPEWWVEVEGQNRNKPPGVPALDPLHALWRSERVGISDARTPSGLIGNHRENPKETTRRTFLLGDCHSSL